MTPGTRASLAAGVAATLTLAGSLPAQEWRTIESSRQLQGDSPATVRVEFGAGTIDLVPTNDRVLYRMKLRYDAERSSPIASYDATDRRATIGTRSASARGWGGKRMKEGNTLHAELSRALPMRLALELGATRGDIALGGLRLTDLSLKAGASETRLDFATPNPEALRLFDLDVGAATVTVRRGGNARARRVHVNVGAGALDYDLAGDWDGEVELGANVAVGSMTLRLPRDVGIRLTAKTFLADLSKSGLEKRGDGWYSPGYESTTRRVRLDVTAVLGGVEIVRQ